MNERLFSSLTANERTKDNMFRRHTKYSLLARASLGAILVWGIGGCAPKQDAAVATRDAAPAAGAEASAASTSLPDWSGIWENSGTPSGKVIFWPFDRATADPPGEAPPRAGDREHPPYKPEWEAKYVALLEDQKKGKFFDPETNCLPAGFPRLLAEPYSMEFIVTPRQTWMIFEQNSQVRRIYTDGRPHPPQEDLFPLWNGHSIGHWEGQTLVVSTVSLKAGQFDRTGAPFSEQVTVTERIRMIDNDTIENDVIVTDPVMFTQPWNVKRYFRRVKDPGVFILDWSCQENNRNSIKDGETQLLLPGEPGYRSPDEPRKH